MASLEAVVLHEVHSSHAPILIDERTLPVLE